jgi:hypothetical protein
MQLDAILTMIGELSRAPDCQLDASLSKECAEFNGSTLEDALVFVRDLRDVAVHIGGASTFVMQLFAVILDEHPEDPAEMATRREALEARGKRCLRASNG